MPHKISSLWADTPLLSSVATSLVLQLQTPWLCLSCKSGQRPFCAPDPWWHGMAWLHTLGLVSLQRTPGWKHPNCPWETGCAVSWTVPRYCLDNTEWHKATQGLWQLLNNRYAHALTCTLVMVLHTTRIDMISGAGTSFYFVGESVLAQQVLYYWRKLFGMMEKVSCYYSALQIFLGNLACEIRVRWKWLCSDIFLHFLKLLFFFL